MMNALVTCSSIWPEKRRLSPIFGHVFSGMVGVSVSHNLAMSSRSPSSSSYHCSLGFYERLWPQYASLWPKRQGICFHTEVSTRGE